MRLVRNAALLLAATLFGLAQAHIAPWFDPGETGSGVRVVSQLPAAHVARGPATHTASQTAMLPGHVAAQWFDPGYQSANGTALAAAQPSGAADQSPESAREAPPDAASLAGNAVAQRLDPGPTFGSLGTSLANSEAIGDFACRSGFGLAVEAAFSTMGGALAVGVSGPCRDVLAWFNQTFPGSAAT